MKSLFLRTGVSLSLRASSFAAMTSEYEPLFFAGPPLRDAPYPAFSTAEMISEAEAVPSTPMELVSRLTEQDVTPGTPQTAFSTLALHAAQLIPVTLYCSIMPSSLRYLSYGADELLYGVLIAVSQIVHHTGLYVV